MYSWVALLVNPLHSAYVTDQNVNGEVFMDPPMFMATVNCPTTGDGAAVTAGLTFTTKCLTFQGFTVLKQPSKEIADAISNSK